MSSQPAIAALSTPRKLLLGSGVLLLVNSFLPWYHVSAFGMSASASGWHQIGTLAWIVLIATLIWEGVRLAGAAPLPEKQGDLVTAAGAGLVVVLGVIFLIVRLSDGGLGIGFWLGLVLLAAFAYGAFQLFQAAGGQAAISPSSLTILEDVPAADRGMPSFVQVAGSRGMVAYTPAAAPTGTFTSIAAGDALTCAIDTAKEIHCWGIGPITTIPPGPFVSVTPWGRPSSGAMTCGLRPDGEAICWDYSKATNFAP